MTNTSSQSELERIRQAISNIDSEILRLASQRLQLAHAAGTFKLAQGLPFKDRAIEAQVLDAGLQHAQSLGLPPQLAAALLKQLMKHALIVQEELLRSAKRQLSSDTK